MKSTHTYRHIHSPTCTQAQRHTSKYTNTIVIISLNKTEVKANVFGTEETSDIFNYIFINEGMSRHERDFYNKRQKPHIVQPVKYWLQKLTNSFTNK